MFNVISLLLRNKIIRHLIVFTSVKENLFAATTKFWSLSCEQSRELHPTNNRHDQHVEQGKKKIPRYLWKTRGWKRAPFCSPCELWTLDDATQIRMFGIEFLTTVVENSFFSLPESPVTLCTSDHEKSSVPSNGVMWDMCEVKTITSILSSSRAI